MATTIGRYKVRKLPPEMTLNVEIVLTKEYRLRLWLGMLLVKMAARVMGCRIKINEPSI